MGLRTGLWIEGAHGSGDAIYFVAMTSSEGKPQVAEKRSGSLLPAALAGVGILVVAGILFFGGEDEGAKPRAGAEEGAAKRSETDRRSGPGGVAARSTDQATPSGRTQPKLNPRFAGKLPTGGMAPGTSSAKEEPTSFPNAEAEREYWRDRVDEAKKTVEMRQRAIERLPELEQAIRDGNDPENGLKDFERRKQVVTENLARDQAKLAEAEAKLGALGG